MTIHIIVHGMVDVFLSSLTHLTHTVKVSSPIKNYVFLINLMFLNIYSLFFISFINYFLFILFYFVLFSLFFHLKLIFY